MLWSLIVSAYVIYLYRKLNAEAGADAPRTSGMAEVNDMADIEAELAKLNADLDHLEHRLATG